MRHGGYGAGRGVKRRLMIPPAAQFASGWRVICWRTLQMTLVYDQGQRQSTRKHISLPSMRYRGEVFESGSARRVT